MPQLSKKKTGWKLQAGSVSFHLKKIPNPSTMPSLRLHMCSHLKRILLLSKTKSKAGSLSCRSHLKIPKLSKKKAILGPQVSSLSPILERIQQLGKEGRKSIPQANILIPILEKIQQLRKKRTRSTHQASILIPILKGIQQFRKEREKSILQASIPIHSPILERIQQQLGRKGTRLIPQANIMM